MRTYHFNKSECAFSYAWKSILYGRDLLIQGLRYVIGDGSLVDMWADPWIPDHPPRAPRAIGEVIEGEKVREYFDESRCHWNEQKLREVIPEDVERILNIRITPHARQDLLGWHYNENGLYTVKSGYWLGTHLPTNPQPIPIYGSAELKHKVWRTKSPQKLKHFLWSLLSRCLATGSNLKRRHITLDDQCKRCCDGVETEKHLFFECPYAKRIWRASGVDNMILNSATSSLEEKIDVCLQCSLSSRLIHFQDLPLWILWRIWKSRNTLVFQHKELPWRSLLRYAKDDAQEWKQHENVGFSSGDARGAGQGERSMASRNENWKRPSRGWLKCNTDGSFDRLTNRSSAGWILRDENGVYKGSAQAKGRLVNDALESELQAILMALQHVWSQGYDNLILESDCQKAVGILTEKKMHFGYYNWVRDIKWWARRFNNICFTWTARKANKVADRLARRVVDSVDFVSHFYVPHYIQDILHVDYICSS